ncbi:hypothetical protein F8M41_024128 [Gigaspora margarita]|uniref:Uncharacterized protein n=1 Tax=Gigaspora margarita TaxID=4874 RepID=A0A8H4ET69_GIGMA|nr:hypothetical protein F8M41_024128 [Gigaspora margarita]
MSLAKLQNFALNILKVTNHTVVQDTDITELLPCPECDKKILRTYPDQDKITEANLQKRKKRAKKIFRLFNGIGDEKLIDWVKSLHPSNISNLNVDDIDYVIAKVLKVSSSSEQFYCATVIIIVTLGLKMYQNIDNDNRK